MRTLRAGLTLIEIVVVMAMIGIVLAIGGVSMSELLDLKQRGAAKELAQTYTWLIDEATMRNVSFRIVYYLDRSAWKVEVGDPNTLAFANPEEREAFQEEMEDKMARFTQRELDEGAMSEIEEATGQFTGLEDPTFANEQKLPGGSRFLYVYTAQYAPDGMEPNEEPPEDPEDEKIAYTYIFPDGTAEHSVIRIVDIRDIEDGYTLEVEPLSGRVHLSTDLVDPEESMDWIPEEGPEIN